MYDGIFNKMIVYKNARMQFLQTGLLERFFVTWKPQRFLFMYASNLEKFS